jgi:protease-4
VASEVIRRELVRLNEAKPLVVSMGSSAASGGYWIATACDRIFAEPTTVTGSIGVFAILPNVEGLAERFAVNFESVKTGKHADVFSIAKPRSEETMAMLQDSINDTYEKFLDRVVEGRNLSREEVAKIAEGHVWSGSDALRLGLVDEIGGLDRAITHAVSLANLEDKDHTVVDYPEAEDFFKRFFERLSGQRRPLAAKQSPTEAAVDRVVEQIEAATRTFHDSTGIYARMPMYLRID